MMVKRYMPLMNLIKTYKTIALNASSRETSFAMAHFPYTIPGSPESKYYVQLLLKSSASLDCMYSAYWKYGVNNLNTFPSHWWYNASLFQIKNYIEFQYKMIRSNDSSIDEDYWYSNVICQPDTGRIIPCQNIYFQKNTDVSLRSTRVVRRGWNFILETKNSKVISIGQPDDKYFDSIPKYWFINCRDINLGLFYYPLLSNITLNQSTKIHISLVAPPHRINGTDTLTIQWKTNECVDCVTWTPSEITFNMKNFTIEQISTITRVKDGSKTTLIPIFNGGGFDRIDPATYPIFIQ